MTAVANDRILFVHIPKTGGTWVSEAMEAAGVHLEPIGESHHPEKPELEPHLGNRFAFGFVREPLSWYWSVWKFHRRNALSHWPNINRFIDRDFTGFLEGMVDEVPGYLAGFYQAFVGRPEDQINFVGRYERLADDLVTALRSAGQDFDEKILRAMPARNFDSEEKTYGKRAPSSPPPDCPAALKARLIESEHEIYDRYYDGKDAALGEVDDAAGTPSRISSEAVFYGRRMAAREPDPIIVFGAPRSGTTYLEQVLNAHPEVFISHETRVFAWLHHALRLTDDHRIVANHREAFVDYLRSTFPQMMREFYSWLAPDVRYWGDKNPHYADPFNHGTLDLVAELFPGSRFIHIIRDGRDVVSSLTRKRWKGDKPWVSFEEAHFTWKKHVRFGRTFGEALPSSRYFELHYEDLIADDVAMAAKLFDFLDIEPDPAVEAFCRGQRENRTPFKDPTRDFGNDITVSDWSSLFTPEEQARSLELIGPPLVRYGYETQESLAELRRRAAEALAAADDGASMTSANPAEG